MNIKTAIDMKTRLKLFELGALNEKTVKSPTLKEIIEYCVPRRLLARIILTGYRGNEIHTRLEVSIDYDKDGGSCLTVKSDFDRKVFTPGADGDNQQSGWSPTESQQSACPLWSKIIDWFTKLCKDNGLHLSWNIRFNDQHDFLYKKFGFTSCGGVSKTIDKTSDAVIHSVTNSNVSSLKMTTKLSPELQDGRPLSEQVMKP